MATLRDPGRIQRNQFPIFSLLVSADSLKIHPKLSSSTMPLRRLIEVNPPSPFRYLIGLTIMMIGVVLPVGYMMFRNKRVPSSSSYSKHTNKVLI